jgi:hypothetical protein
MVQPSVMDKITQYSAVLLGFTMTTASFLYSIGIQLAHTNAPVGQWVNLIHLCVDGGISFLASLLLGIVWATSSWHRKAVAALAFALFLVGIVFALSVLIGLWLQTRL